MESRERDHFPRDLQPEGFLSFFELSKYVYIYMQYSLFYCFNKPFHYINWKWKNLLPFFSSSLSGYCVSCPSECQVSVGNQIKLCDDLTDSLFWSACFFLWNPFQKIMGRRQYLMSISAWRPDRRKITTHPHYWMPLETRKLYFLHWFLRKNRKANYLEGYFPLWFCIWLRP